MAASLSGRSYRWRKGSFGLIKKDAVVFGRELERIKKGDGWTTASIVSEARPKTSPIHHMFEWNDKVAGNKYRESQARVYVQHLTVEIISNTGAREMPVAVSFRTGAKNEGYTATETVMSNTELRERLIAQALDEVEVWRRRYRYLNELAAVFEEVDKALARRAKQDVGQPATV